jgi:hypothetical protein
MKWIFHFDSLETKTKITKELLRLYINRGNYMLYSINGSFLIYNYIYSLYAVDLFLNYISYNECELYELEGYYYNFLKIVIALYEDLYEDEFNFSYIIYHMINKLSLSEMIDIQKEVMTFYDYNFNMVNIIDAIDGYNRKECLLAGRYIESKIFTRKFLNLSPEEKVNKILKKINSCF